MSRIGKRPISIPNKVTITLDGQKVAVKGHKGELSRVIPAEIVMGLEGETLLVTRRDESRVARQLHGLCRTLVANMVEGVSQGFQRRLEIIGTGYRAAGSRTEPDFKRRLQRARWKCLLQKASQWQLKATPTSLSLALTKNS